MNAVVGQKYMLQGVACEVTAIGTQNVLVEMEWMHRGSNDPQEVAIPKAYFLRNATNQNEVQS